MMRHSNDVHLDGAVSRCQITGEKSGVVVARMTVFTLHPKAPDLSGYRPSEKFEKIFHHVRVAVRQDAADRLRTLDELSRSGGIKDLHPVSLDGLLAVVDGSPVVDVRGEGLKFVDRLSNSENNHVTLSGRVNETTFTDKAATMVLDVDGMPVRVNVARSTNPKGWEDIKDHKVGKGDEVSLEGPLLSRRYTNGKETLFTCSVAARKLETVKLAKEERRSRGGVSI